MQDKKLTIDDCRSMLIRYSDRLAIALFPYLDGAMERIEELSEEPEKLLEDDAVLKGLTGGLATLVAGGIMGGTDAGRFMCAIRELGGKDGFVYIFSSMLIGTVVALYGVSDGKGGCEISKEGAKAFRSFVKKCEGRGFGLMTNTTLASNLPAVFKEYMADALKMAEACVPDMDIRYAALDGDRIKAEGDLDNELKFILDCPHFAVPYYDDFIKALEEKAAGCREAYAENRGNGADNMADIVKLLDGYCEAFREFRSIADGYANGRYSSPDEVISVFREKLKEVS